jgi:hypothetical protein
MHGNFCQKLSWQTNASSQRWKTIWLPILSQIFFPEQQPSRPPVNNSCWTSWQWYQQITWTELSCSFASSAVNTFTIKVTLVDIWVLIHWRTQTAANFVTNLFHGAAYLIGIWEFTHGVANHSHHTAIWRSTGEEGMLNKLVQTDEQNVSAIKMYSSLKIPFKYWKRV